MPSPTKALILAAGMGIPQNLNRLLSSLLNRHNLRYRERSACKNPFPVAFDPRALKRFSECSIKRLTCNYISIFIISSKKIYNLTKVGKGVNSLDVWQPYFSNALGLLLFPGKLAV